MMNKWLSRKLWVAVVSVIAIAWSIHTGNAADETGVMQQGTELSEALIGAIGITYIVVEGIIDKIRTKKETPIEPRS